MKFSEFEVEQWADNRNFYDTCLIPFTGLSGSESPPETVQALERLRDFMDLVEIPFKGRIVTYPAIQYGGGGYVELINEVCQKVKSSGFQYAVVLTADIALLKEEIFESDLVLSLPIIESSLEGKINSDIGMKIQEMWRR
ncbi:DUF2487 family protein [Paenibacillus sp. B-A-8]|uniref:DUF2487 family protein n=1 Tax=Paenibacillus sp. B-A-8 TaxID=3400419 RepID=UPI003B025E00